MCGKEIHHVARRRRFQELDEQGRSPHEKDGRRDHHQVGGCALTEVEADGEPADALGVVRRLRIAGTQGETRRNRYRLGEMRGLGELGGVGGRRELSGQAEAFVLNWQTNL